MGGDGSTGPALQRTATDTSVLKSSSDHSALKTRRASVSDSRSMGSRSPGPAPRKRRSKEKVADSVPYTPRRGKGNARISRSKCLNNTELMIPEKEDPTFIKGNTQEINQHLSTVFEANPLCADCPEVNPRWASFLRFQGGQKVAGVMLCSNCAQNHHFVLGDKRCRIKYTAMTHEWTMEDVLLLEETGNSKVNQVLEAQVTQAKFHKSLVLEEDEEGEDSRRSKFVKQKYKQHKFASMDSDLIKRLLEEEPVAPSMEKEEERPESRSSNASATTMDSSSGSLDSSGNNKHRKEKPDMDWGSHAAKIEADKGGKKMGSTSGHSKKKESMGISSGHNKKNKETTPAGKRRIKKSLSSNALPIHKSPKNNKAAPKVGGRVKMNPLLQIMAMDASCQPQAAPEKKSVDKKRSSAEKKGNNISPLLQIMAMDASYQTQEACPKSPSKKKTFDDMVQIVKQLESDDSSLEEEEAEEDGRTPSQADSTDDSSDDEDNPKQQRRVPKASRRRTNLTRSKTTDDANLRRKMGSKRRAKGVSRSKTLEDVSSTLRPKRSQASEESSKRRGSARDLQVPSTPKTGRKTRAQSTNMLSAKSPQSDDQSECKERRRNRRGGPRMNIHEQTGLVTPRQQSKRSVTTATATAMDIGLATPSGRGRRARQQPAVPALSLDLDDGSDDDSDDNHQDPALDGLITPRRTTRKRSVAIPSPLDLGYDDDDQQQIIQHRPGRRASMGSETNQSLPGRRASMGSAHARDNDMMMDQDDTGIMINQSEYVERTRTAGQQRVRSPAGRRNRSLLLLDTDDEGEEDHSMSQSERIAKSSRRGQNRPAQDPLNVSRRRRDMTAAGHDDNEEEEEDHLMSQSERIPTSSRRGHNRAAQGRRRDSCRDMTTVAGDDEDTMDQSERNRRRGGGPRRSLLDKTGSVRRQSKSLGGLEKLKGMDDDNIKPTSKDDDEGSVGSARSFQFTGSNRGRRHQAMDDTTVGSRRNSSVSRGGRYGYANEEQRLCLTSVAAPKKSVGLAALLYCKPLDLGDDDTERTEDDEKVSATNEKVPAPENPIPEKGDDQEEPVDKAQAKKDYWKTKLAAGKEGNNRGLRSRLL